MKKQNSVCISVIVLLFIILLCGTCLFTKGGGDLGRVRADGDSATNGDAQQAVDATTAAATVSVSLQVTTASIDTAALAALTDQYTDTMKEKNELQSTLNDLMESQNSYIARLNELDDLILGYQDKLDDIQERTNMAVEMSRTLENQVEVAQTAQDAQYESLKAQIAQEYENGMYSYMDALFDSTDYSDVVNKAEYIQAVDSFNNSILSSLTEKKKTLNNKKTLLDGLTDDMMVLQQAYQDEQDTLQFLAEEKEKQIANYQTSIDEVSQQEKQLESKLSSIEASYSLSASSGGSGGSFSNDPNFKYSGEAFLWPSPTCTTISSYYGSRVAPTAGASTFHKGIDIDAVYGSEIVAAAAGKVTLAEYDSGGGNMVAIDHGSYLTTVYMHMSRFACKVGDTVKRGQVIGYVGSTGVSTGPHLHFGVRVNGNYVNPLSYFPNIKDLGNSSSSSSSDGSSGSSGDSNDSGNSNGNSNDSGESGTSGESGSSSSDSGDNNSNNSGDSNNSGNSDDSGSSGDSDSSGSSGDSNSSGNNTN